MKIYAPIENVNGVYASVRFVNSVGETNNPALIHWFKTHGYRVEEETTKPTVETQLNEVLENETVEVDLDSMQPNELREWMKANGYGSKIKNIRNKEKLLAIIRG